MGPTPTELAEEQAYFDLAHRHRERRRAGLGDVPSAAAHPGAAAKLRSWMKSKKDVARSRDAIAFGRMDDESAHALYVGHELITDEQREILVINWQSPAAAPFYRATHDDPCGLVRKRTYTCDGNLVTDFQDLLFRQVAGEVAALEASTGVDPLLLSELDSARTGAMRDIVTTIQSAQYELIRAPMDQVLVIEGGPGTGKTAVALHRVSWLLFNHRDRLTPADVLVVGPHPAFTRYIGTVLPALGDVDVAQKDISQLAPAVRRGLAEPPEVRRLKGDARMAGLLARSLEARIGAPEPAERMSFEGRFFTLPGVEVAAALDACRKAGGGYAQRRRNLRARLLDLVRQRGGPADRERLEPVDNLVERLWPQLSAPALLRGLFASLPRLTAAAGGDFTTEEVALLHRRGADRLSEQLWSAADLPLLDEAEDLINGVDRRYRHIVVDEVQDLSPMQLRGIARRSVDGSMTIVGDLAQSTGAWARDDWDEVTAHLPASLPRSIATLRYGYRVPRRVYQLAAALLPVAAPGTQPLTVVREGPADPGVHQVDPDERPRRVVAIATAHASAGRFVGVICPPACRADLERALAAGGVTWGSAEGGELDSPINLVSPREARGLEFDAVVILEPEEIVAGDERGHRMLFVAMTRTTRYLDIVCVGDPLPLAPPVPRSIPRQRTAPEADAAYDAGQLDQVAQQIAAIVTGGTPAPWWDEALQRAATILDRQSGRSVSGGRHRRE